MQTEVSRVERCSLDVPSIIYIKRCNQEACIPTAAGKKSDVCFSFFFRFNFFDVWLHPYVRVRILLTAYCTPTNNVRKHTYLNSYTAVWKIFGGDKSGWGVIYFKIRVTSAPAGRDIMLFRENSSSWHLFLFHQFITHHTWQKTRSARTQVSSQSSPFPSPKHLIVEWQSLSDEICFWQPTLSIHKQ